MGLQQDGGYAIVDRLLGQRISGGWGDANAKTND
jgi:hypothetical protein